MATKRSNSAGPDDRLSNLSDDILIHILSFFLDMESTARISILSRRFRHLWKDAPVSHLYETTFPSSPPSSVHEFIVPRRTYRGARVNLARNKFVMTQGRKDLCSFPPVVVLRGTFDMVLSHAASLGTGHELRAMSVSESRLFDAIYGPLAASIILRHRHHESLETLELVDCLSVRLRTVCDTAVFPTLTTLELRGCLVADDYDDPFSHLPCLRSLKVIDCYSMAWPAAWKVWGLQLRDLEIRGRGVNIGRVVAPKLESLCYFCDIRNLRALQEMSLPSLCQATVSVYLYNVVSFYDEARRGLVSLLHGLRHAESLDLSFDLECRIPKECVAFTRLKAFVNDEVPRFVKLETVRIYYPL